MSGIAVTGAMVNPDPLYQALVFIPNGALPPLVDGPSCGTCESLTRDEAVASSITGADGRFTLVNVPAGSNIPLVVQLGDWRYQTTIDVAPCVDNVLAPGTARLPRTQSEGNIPLTAISTGNVDSLECVLRKMGIAESEFSNPPGPGRIHLYRNNGVTLNAATPNQDALTGASGGTSSFGRYDQILLPCEGIRSDESDAALNNFLDYTSRGGRIFATHFSYTWLYKNTGFASAARWNVDQVNPMSPITANIDTSSRGGADFATWLQSVGALSNVSPPQVSLSDPRRNIDAVPPSSGGQRWIYADTPPMVLHMSVDTPVLATPDQLCGRVIYSDFHGTDAANSGLTFPAECSVPGFTAQEQILEFMVLNLSGCIGPMRPGKGRPPVPPPPPLPD